MGIEQIKNEMNIGKGEKIRYNSNDVFDEGKGKRMFLLKEKTFLNEQVFRAVIEAPLIAKKAQPGQFVIVRVCEEGEPIPLTISDFDWFLSGGKHENLR